MKKFLFAILLLFAFQFSNAQVPYSNTELPANAPQWVIEMFKPNADPGLVADLYEHYFKTHDFYKNFYSQYYKHWMMTHARDNDGALFNLPLDENKFSEQKYLENCTHHDSSKAAVWQCIGPFDFDHHAASTSYAPGAAHVYTIEQSASDPNTLYAGTANAGVWKSIDKGDHWTNLTKDMMISKVRALEIDFTNPQIVYFNGAGKIYKTTDGGSTWTVTGNATFQATNIDANDLMMSSVNNNELWIAAGVGLYHTIDGGTNWTQLQSGVWQELEIKPDDASIMYAIKQTGVKTEFYKSIDGGATFTVTGIGYPNAVTPQEQKRTEISVTPAAPDIIYAFATGVANGGSGLYGIYVSHDAGENWNFQCCGTGPGGAPDTGTNKNLCGWDDHGGDDGGQYYYDLALCVSPFDSNEVHVGAVNHWVSHDAGVTWNCPAKWSHSDKPMYVHADIHDIRFYNNNWWIACDGGIFYSASLGDTFTKKQYGIAGTDFWGFGMGEWDGDEVMVGGTYHNGTQLKDNNVYENDWMSTMGGDNILGAVNYAEPNIIFSDYGRHQLSHDRTVDLQNIGSGMQPDESYITGENGDLDFNPRVWGKVYIGRDTSIWISEDNGLSYQLLHGWSDGKITSIEIAPSNPNVIYACYYQSYGGAKKLFKSIDAGITWTNVTPPASVFNNSNSAIPFDIAVSSTNENELWLVRTQQSTGQSNLNGYKVFKTIDGGNTWQNLTTVTLDGEYITCIEHQRGTNGGVYIGTRRAVYYRNNSMTDWVLYNSGLPASTFSTQIQIDYKDQKVVNAGNRSVWEAPLYEPSTVQALISVDKNIVHCTRDTVYFDDHSNMADLNPTWNWSFPGGNPSSSNLRNPKVVYANTGIYGVTLTVTNTTGTSTQMLDSFITVYNECMADTVPGNCLSLEGNSAVATGPALNLNSNHVTITAWIKPQGTQNDWGGIVFCRGGTTTAGVSIKSDNEIRIHWNDGEWWWGSGLYATENQWNYIALSVTPDSATLYVNGIPSTDHTALSSEEFNSALNIGEDPNGGSRFFTGLIDEVCVYNRSLSKNEIRELMHLTKKPQDDSSLVRYYQFDESIGPILDKVGIAHANLNGGASRVISSGPFGGGVSYRKNITVTGTHSFINTGFTINWNATSTVPDGDVVVSRINLHPDQIPSANWNARSYWIMDNYGANSLFSVPQTINFNGIGNVSVTDATNPNRFKLFLRTHNADGNTWGSEADSASSCSQGADGSATFNTVDSLITSCQMDIINSSIITVGEQIIPNENFQTAINVYPSLVESGVEIHIKTSLNSECKFVLNDLTGRRLMVISFSKETTINTKNFAAGLYTFSVMSDNYQQNGKIEVIR